MVLFAFRGYRSKTRLGGIVARQEMLDAGGYQVGYIFQAPPNDKRRTPPNGTVRLHRFCLHVSHRDAAEDLGVAIHLLRTPDDNGD